MNPDSNSFEIIFGEEKLKVQRHSVGSQTIFRIIFSNSKAPLVITRASGANGYRFWTSIPEGRQKEAEAIGPFIEQYYKN